MSHPQRVHKERALRLNFLHIAICSALAVPTLANAQQNPVSELSPVKVQGSAPGFQPEAVQSTKFQAPLLDTPQSITIVPAEVLKQQGAQSLQDVLGNVPGITFSSGEGGAGWGDMFTIRGFSAEQSITTDGVRESALSTRTDIFNLEQAEVYKGTGSVESGVAAIGGSVNLVSKSPKRDQFYDFSTGLGTDRHRRVTADLNQPFGDSMAFRLNAMYHENEVAGRKHADFERWGVAPSLAWGLGTPTRVVASYFHQKDKNTPDFGVPMSRNGGRMQGIGRDYWGGLSNADIEETENNSATLLVEHDFNDKTSIRNQTRWSETKRYTLLNTGGRLLNARNMDSKTGAISNVATAPGGYVTGNTNDYWGYDAQGNETYPTGNLAVPRLNPNMNSYKGTVIANQTDLNFDFDTGTVRHRLATGLELYEESYRKDPHNRLVPDLPGRRVIDVRNPDTHYTGAWKPANYTDESGAKVSNVGVYVYDQITLNPNWEIAGGLRYDRFRVKWYDANGFTLPEQQKDGVWSGRLGLVYKPVEYGSIYLSYSQATQPSASDAASRTGGGLDSKGNVQQYSPGTAKSWELGTKWDLLDERLSVTAALFQVERSNPTDANPDNPSENIQSARKDRVRGFELGVAGNITQKWSAYGGLSLMDGGRIIEDAADPLQEGGKLKNVPKTTFNFWTTYAFNPQWDASLGAQYVGKRRHAAGNTVAKGPFAGQSTDNYADSYWVANASVGYNLNKNVSLRLNVNNIFDKFYLQQASSSSDGFQLFGVPGAGRTVVLNADMRF
ncbi:MAG: TonB-dependent siderophore receptor [Burkholderiaceae bacterium]|nr:TonB-dependent siderophore receptor [Burkholderiaceae bacterium]